MAELPLAVGVKFDPVTPVPLHVPPGMLPVVWITPSMSRMVPEVGAVSLTYRVGAASTLWEITASVREEVAVPRIQLDPSTEVSMRSVGRLMPAEVARQRMCNASPAGSVSPKARVMDPPPPCSLVWTLSHGPKALVIAVALVEVTTAVPLPVAEAISRSLRSMEAPVQMASGRVKSAGLCGSAARSPNWAKATNA